MLIEWVPISLTMSLCRSLSLFLFLCCIHIVTKIRIEHRRYSALQPFYDCHPFEFYGWLFELTCESVRWYIMICAWKDVFELFQHWWVVELVVWTSSRWIDGKMAKFNKSMITRIASIFRWKTKNRKHTIGWLETKLFMYRCRVHIFNASQFGNVAKILCECGN